MTQEEVVVGIGILGIIGIILGALIGLGIYGLIGGFIAKKKGYDFWPNFFLAFFLEIIGIILIAVKPSCEMDDDLDKMKQKSNRGTTYSKEFIASRKSKYDPWEVADYFKADDNYRRELAKYQLQKELLENHNPDDN